MATELFQFHAFPKEVAITQTEFVETRGVFFLDFSRPLKRLRWLGVTNQWLGFTTGLFVPVVHQSETKGEFIVGIGRADPYYDNIIKLWKERYPSSKTLPAMNEEPLQIIGDFGHHFPLSCQPVHDK